MPLSEDDKNKLSEASEKTLAAKDRAHRRLNGEVIQRQNQYNPSPYPPSFSWYCQASDSWGEREYATVYHDAGLAVLNLERLRKPETKPELITLAPADSVTNCRAVIATAEEVAAALAITNERHQEALKKLADS